jgi:hypothetical protein
MESRNRTVRYRSRISGLGAALLLSMQISAGHTAAAAVLRDMDMERKGEVRKGKGKKKATSKSAGRLPPSLLIPSQSPISLNRRRVRLQHRPDRHLHHDAVNTPQPALTQKPDTGRLTVPSSEEPAPASYRDTKRGKGGSSPISASVATSEGHKPSISSVQSIITMALSGELRPGPFRLWTLCTGPRCIISCEGVLPTITLHSALLHACRLACVLACTLHVHAWCVQYCVNLRRAGVGQLASRARTSMFLQVKRKRKTGSLDVVRLWAFGLLLAVE